MAAARRIAGDYQILCTLGQGVSAKVKKARKRDGSLVAMKLVNSAALSANQVQKLKREVEATAKCSHPNVIKLNKVDWKFQYPKKNGTTVPRVLMELEFAEGGELFNFLMFTGCFPEDIARTYFQQLVDGLAHCHSKGVSHRDLKAENLLLDREFRLKIADFGLSAIHDTEDWLETECGTKGYMSPEVFNNRGYKGPQADIWSMGVVLFIMLTGFPPFQIAKPGDWWFDRIQNSQYTHFWNAHLRNARVSEAAMDLMNKIFVADPERRATLDQIKEHPWVKQRMMTHEAVKAELTRRKAKVEEARREDKQRKQREKQRAMMGRGGHHFDPDQITYRAVRAAGEGEAAVAKPAPPIPREGVSHFTSFRVSADAPEIMSRLGQALSKITASHIPNNDTYKVKTTIDTPAGRINAAVQIYAAGENHVVEIRRRKGNTLKFQQLYNSICEDLADIITIA